MRKVMLDVVYMCGGKVGFAVLCVGVETRRNIYVKVESVCDPEKKYLKVRKKDTKISNCRSTIDFDVYREIEVPGSVGLMDKRLHELEDESLIKVVDEVSLYYNKELDKMVG